MKKIVFIIGIILFFSRCEKEVVYKDTSEYQDEGVIVNTNPYMLTMNNSSLNNTNGPGLYYDSTGQMRVLKESLPDEFLNSIDTGYLLSVDLDTTGILRKVENIYIEGQEAVFETEQAEMGDVFLNAEFTLSTEEYTASSYKSTMTNEEISRAFTDNKGMIHPVRITYYTSQGIIVKNATNDFSAAKVDGYELKISDTLVDKEHLQVWLDAYLKAYSNFILKFDYQSGYIERSGWRFIYHPGRLAYFGAYYNGSIETGATLNAVASYEEEFEKVKKLKNDLFKISYKFFVGPVPVFIDVSCDIYAKISGGFSGEVSASSGFQSSANIKLGIEYSNGSISPIKDFSTEKSFDPLTIEGSANAQARAEIYPQFMLSIYSAGGPTFELVPYIEAQANASSTYSLGDNAFDAGWDASVDFGVDARVGAKLEILGKTLAEYNSGNLNIIKPVNIWSVPSSIEIVQGNYQQGSAGSSLSNPLLVVVKDSWSNPFPIIPVVYSIESGDGSLTKQMVLSNSQGKAENYWTLGNTGLNACKALVKKADGTVVDFVIFNAQAAK